MSAAKLTRAVMVAAALSLALGACAANSGGSSSGGSSPSSGINLPALTTLNVPADAANPAGDGKAKCSGLSIAFGGAETGPNAQLGLNILYGVQTALDAHNTANPGCQVQLKKFDTQGSSSAAPGLVTQMASEQDIVGAVGLAFSGESAATGGIFQQAGLVHITASATNPTLTQNGWTTFFRGLGNDNAQGPAAAKFITGTLKDSKVCVVQDDSAYGKGLAASITPALGSANDTACNDKVTTGQKDFSSTVNKVNAAKADAIFYSGYYAEAAPLDQQLVQAGFKGTFVGPDGVKDPQFLKLAGSAASNAIFTCPCTDGALVPSFASAYAKVANGASPGTYSVEGYDIATILLKGIDAGNTTRAQLVNYVKNYSGDGLSKHFQWGPTGELTSVQVYAYAVQNGKIVAVKELSS
ncbi:MAG TPA: branched-chain amino acid ABC transporter substrate-binding protein [Pseudonocardiaceae bacterium]|nr:branched-chain amino acid ABC transporter substrate-binding protein [Pseudonocardiaceae bacterium]